MKYFNTLIYTHCLYIGALLLWPLTVMANMIEFEAWYTASTSEMPFSGKAVRKLELLEDGSWLLNFNAKLFLYSLNEESHFQVLKSGEIKPLSYKKKTKTIGKQRKSFIKFDWEKKQTINNDKKKRSVPIELGYLDKISYQLKLRDDIKKGKKEFRYNVIDKDEIDDLHFIIAGEEILNTPIGKLKTIKLKLNRDNKKRQTFIWLAKDINYLIVKVKQIEDKTEYIMTIQKAIIGGKTIT